MQTCNVHFHVEPCFSSSLSSFAVRLFAIAMPTAVLGRLARAHKKSKTKAKANTTTTPSSINLESSDEEAKTKTTIKIASSDKVIDIKDSDDEFCTGVGCTRCETYPPGGVCWACGADYN